MQCPAVKAYTGALDGAFGTAMMDAVQPPIRPIAENRRASSVPEAASRDDLAGGCGRAPSKPQAAAKTKAQKRIIPG
jgi:hypothetical protein